MITSRVLLKKETKFFSDFQRKSRRNIYKKVPDTKFGVELEFLSETKEDYPVLAATLNRTMKKNQLEYWKVVRDGTIMDPMGRTGFEVVSPVMAGEKGLQNVRDILKFVNEFGVDINETCGFHVHVDAEEIELEKLKNIVKHYLRYEHVFDSMVTMDRLSNKTCSSHFKIYGSVEQGINCIDRCTTVEELIDSFSPERHYKLNIKPMRSNSWKPNIEFRLHHGSKDESEIINWILLLLRFVEHIRIKF